MLPLEELEALAQELAIELGLLVSVPLSETLPEVVTVPVMQVDPVCGWVLLGVALAHVLGDWLPLGLPLDDALSQELLLAAGDTLGRADALPLDDPLSLRMLLSVLVRVAVPVAHGVAELLMSARLAVGARECEALLLSVAVLLAVAGAVPLTLALAQRLGAGLSLTELLALPLSEDLPLALVQALAEGLL